VTIGSSGAGRPSVAAVDATHGPSAPTPGAAASRPLVARRVPFDAVAPAAWDALAARTTWATPFARWAFHRAWWDGYGENAHDETVVVVDPAAESQGDDGLVGIVPLMHRHGVEPTDAARETTLRRDPGGTPTPLVPTDKVVFFGASYHADYATVLADPADLPAVAEAVVDLLAVGAGAHDAHPEPWDVVDLRRLRTGDPALDALRSAFERRAADTRWAVRVEQEDVCPVVTLPAGVDIDGYLATLGKKERHEIRRKVRRAETAGAIDLVPSADPLADLDAFIDLHQRRWGDDGLFPPTEGGAMSRRFFRRLFELLAGDPILDLRFLEVDGRRIAAGVGFDDGGSVYYYNAGVDPAARDLSPGVVMVERYVRDALARGKRRLDFLRGDEPYKYEWGAVDEPIHRLLVVRT
jgi:CelD/BcsL family acetyltransferase involved in cellulose biosynthesis